MICSAGPDADQALTLGKGRSAGLWQMEVTVEVKIEILIYYRRSRISIAQPLQWMVCEENHSDLRSSFLRGSTQLSVTELKFPLVCIVISEDSRIEPDKPNLEGSSSRKSAP